jgi:hypothetical protein
VYEAVMIPRLLLKLISPVVLIFCSTLSAHDWHDEDSVLNRVNIDVENGTIIITALEDDDEYVKIMDDNSLIVNGKYIRTDWKQKRLIEDYYYAICDVRSLGRKMGIEGVKMGAAGAQVAVFALSRIIKLFLIDEYDSDEFNEALDEEIEEELEERGEYLEELGEELEDRIDDLEELHEEVKEEITALDKLYWF